MCRRWFVRIVLALNVCHDWTNGTTSTDLVCVPLKNCPYLNEAVKNTKNANELFDLLKKSQCGFDGKHAMVWCIKRQQPQPCLTSDSKNGTCISKEKCRTEGNSEELPSSFEYPRDSGCAQETHVCCPQKRNESYKEPPRPSTTCGYNPVSRKIIGGSSTDLDEFPWIGILQYRSGSTLEQACSANLIDKQYLVSAAHCVDPEALEKRKLESVVLGEYNTETNKDCINYDEDYRECSEDPKVIPIESVILHPDWKYPDDANDIALIKLATPVEYTDFIKPICLPAKQWRPRPTEKFLVAGWGKTEREHRSTIKKKAFVKLQQCDISDTKICAGGEGADFCAGDSGGPLMFARNINSNILLHLAGIVSYSVGRCGTVPGIYTFVPRYVDWINSIVQG